MTTPARAIADPLLVATCIACGARTRYGTCPGGCDDVPLDLVERAAVTAQRAWLDALSARVARLREISAALGDDTVGWDDLRARARAALIPGLPERPDPPEVVEAWGCPRCGRVDAPQPCLGVCIGRPVEMTDAAAYRDLAERSAALADVERELAAVVRLLAHVTPRGGRGDETRMALTARTAKGFAA